MSFRLFVYYCALCGSGAAFLGWGLGRLVPVDHPIVAAGIKGMCLGMPVALALGLVDALWNFSLRQTVPVGLRVLIALACGTFGGLLGGFVGQSLFRLLPFSPFLVFGWTITGLLIGASLGVFDCLYCLAYERDGRGARRKLLNGVLGGMAGGVLGGILSLMLPGIWGTIFSNKPVQKLWSPSAMGFVALGLCIGLLIGLAQVILKEAWVRVEAGFRAGRELILSKPETTIGRAESCDIGLFGDPKVSRLHARILLQEGGYFLADAGSGNGTLLNDQMITQPVPLRSGDQIRMGNCVLRFGERQKRAGEKAGR